MCSREQAIAIATTAMHSSILRRLKRLGIIGSNDGSFNLAGTITSVHHFYGLAAFAEQFIELPSAVKHPQDMNRIREYVVKD
jgi:hypothetical protein